MLLLKNSSMAAMRISKVYGKASILKTYPLPLKTPIYSRWTDFSGLSLFLSFIPVILFRFHKTILFSRLSGGILFFFFVFYELFLEVKCLNLRDIDKNITALLRPVFTREFETFLVLDPANRSKHTDCN